MREFRVINLIQKASLLYLVQKIPQDEIDLLDEVFKYMGTITHKTVSSKVKIEYIDFNRSGIVEYSEFLAVTCDH